MKWEEVPEWIIDCVTDMFDCDDEEEVRSSDDFRNAVEIITRHYLKSIGQECEVHLPRS